jgi:glycosyltransferase involved in cell wall biosynthesis
VTNYRILEVVSGLGVGGAEKALISRMRFTPKSFEIEVLNLRPEIDALNMDQHIKEHKIKKQGFFRFLEIWRFLKVNKYHAIIVRTPLDAIRILTIVSIKRINRPRIVFEAHNNYVTKRVGSIRILTYFFHQFSRSIDLTIAVSENVKRGPQCVRNSNVHVVYLGAVAEYLPLQPTWERYSTLLYVGRLVDVKRPVWLLERIANIRLQVNLPPKILTMVGSGPLEKEVKDFLQLHQLEEVVNFVGFESDLAPYYASASHLVSCSTNEGLPLTFFEAKLSGLNIIATPSGGGSEIFGQEDLELKSFDEHEFEKALIEVLNSPAPTMEFRRSVQLKSLWMSAEKGAERYYALITDLLEDKM